jgi:phosphate transport system permease protein
VCIFITLAIAFVLVIGSVEFFEDPDYEPQLRQAVTEFAHSPKPESLSEGEYQTVKASAERWTKAHGNVNTADPDFAIIEQAVQKGIIKARPPVTIWYFLTGDQWTATFGAGALYGILPLLVGTLMVAVIAALVALPIGLTTAIYLSEYANSWVRSVAKPTLELLAGIPTVVYGFFAVYTITPLLANVIPGLGTPYNQLSGGIVVGIMIIPMVASLSEDAMRSVPRSLRDASYALGATQYETSVKVVLPAALSGVVASFILAISRAIGETMAVSLACGDKTKLTLDPREGIATMTSYIVRVAKGDLVHGSTDFNSLFAVGLTLLIMTLAMNIFAQWVSGRYRMVYQ